MQRLILSMDYISVATFDRDRARDLEMIRYCSYETCIIYAIR
jgi:hypothetical protein